MFNLDALEIIRVIAYAWGAPVSFWLGMDALNDRRFAMSAFFVGNALMNLAWLASLVIAAQDITDLELRALVTPLIVANSAALTVALITQMRSKRPPHQNHHPAPPAGMQSAGD